MFHALCGWPGFRRMPFDRALLDPSSCFPGTLLQTLWFEHDLTHGLLLLLLEPEWDPFGYVGAPFSHQKMFDKLKPRQKQVDQV